MNLKGKRVIVVGLGRSGVAAARLCLSRGASVLGTDRAALETLSAPAKELGIELVAGGHAGVDFAGADVIVVSPGVPRFAELDAAEAAGVTVIGELELASRFIPAPIVAVGGTNGKSTATTLLAALLAAAGLRAFVGANLGTPAAEAVGLDLEVVVFEVSSFQLERVPSFRPKVSLLLNITEDHLDRYDSFAGYAAAKGNAFVNQTEDDVAIVPAGDELCLRQARRGKARIVTFGPEGDYSVTGDAVIERATGARFSLASARLHGRHNQYNAAAAIAAARACGVSVEAVGQGLASFQPLPHRMALVAEIGGVRFYDDSKATNVGAAVTALRGLSEERAVLIAGGRDKLGSYEPLVQALLEKGRAVVLIGEAKERIAEAVGDLVACVTTDSLEGAVAVAQRFAKPGDAVLLSPACASFDMFKSYAHRGESFVQAVDALSRAEGQSEASP